MCACVQACMLCTPLHLSLFGSVAVEVVCEVLLVLQGDWKCVHAQHPAPAGADRLKQNYNKMHVTHLLLYMSHTCYCTCHNLLLYMSQPATVHVTHLLLYMSQPVTVHVTHLLLYMSHTCYCTCHTCYCTRHTPATVHVTQLVYNTHSTGLQHSLNWSTTLTLHLPVLVSSIGHRPKEEHLLWRWEGSASQRPQCVAIRELFHGCRNAFTFNEQS